MVEQRIIRAIQAAQPSITFMVANQNAPVPEHVFCEVYTIGDAFVGMPETSNDEFEENISKIILQRASLTYHGLMTSEVREAVLHMAAFLESFQARLNFKEQGFSIIRVHDIQPSSLLKDADMYMTYVLDVTLAVEQSHSFKIDVIDSVEIEGDLETIKYNIEVDI